MSQNGCELFILEPSPRHRNAAREFIGRCLIEGIYFAFEPNDRLPSMTPDRWQEGIKAIVLDRTQAQQNSSAIDEARHRGIAVYVLGDTDDNATPQARWCNPNLVYLLMMDANLTPNHPAMRNRMISRSDEALFKDMIEKLLDATEHKWHDATRYQWQALLNAYELSGDERTLQHLQKLVSQALARENPLDNCDTVAPLLPLFGLAEITRETELIHRCLATLDRYIEITPRWQNCFVNFNWLTRQARGEVAWQVCPILAKAGLVTGDPRYTDLAIEQLLALDKQLYHPATGLWRHGRGTAVHANDSWSRGCAMVFMGLMSVIEQMPDQHVARKHLMARLTRMASTIAKYQRDSGFWCTVIDEPLSAHESSGTAWFTAAFYRGMRLGFLDPGFKTAADRGWEAVKTRLWRGGFPGHNCATTVSPIRSYYVKSQLSPHGWTHFAFRAACERMRFLQSTQASAPAQAAEFFESKPLFH